MCRAVHEYLDRRAGGYARWNPTDGSLDVIIPHGGAVVGPPGRPGLEMDGTLQVWNSVSAANWLGTRDDQQLMALRGYNASLSGTQQAVNVLVYGSAMHVLPRRMRWRTLSRSRSSPSQPSTRRPVPWTRRG